MFSRVQWVEVGVLLAPVEYSQWKETLDVLSCSFKDMSVNVLCCLQVTDMPRGMTGVNPPSGSHVTRVVSSFSEPLTAEMQLQSLLIQESEGQYFRVQSPLLRHFLPPQG